MLMFQISRFSFSKEKKAIKIQKSFDFPVELSVYKHYFVNKSPGNYEDLVRHSQNPLENEISDLEKALGGRAERANSRHGQDAQSVL